MARRRMPAPPEMNLTSLIDVIFLLIIFFMLVNNIISEQTVQMVVPSLEEPKTRELTEGRRVIVSVAPYDYTPADREGDPLAFPGEAQYVRVGQETFALDDLAQVTAALREWKQANPEVEVLLRADAALYYQAVAPVMAAITAAEIQTVNLVAFMPKEQ